MPDFHFDEIGYWSEVKLAIIKEYAQAYSTIMAAAERGKLRNRHVYVDAFAGAGAHFSKASGEFILGSPLNALLVEPPFSEYHLIDLDRGKAEHLRELTRERPNVSVHNEDCNRLLLERILPTLEYSSYRRCLCILDPYGLHLDWKVLEEAGRLRTVDVFLNFPVMDMNMNVLWRNADAVDPIQANRLTAYRGDDSWREAAYATDRNLFGLPEKLGNDEVAKAFKRRLKEKAGFSNVLDPMPMRNDQGATVYYLYFASANSTGNKIAGDIFKKYASRGVRNG